MSRLFAFGCSFTNYRWPTWADILARGFDYSENWGQNGAGNHFIFNSLIECINSNSISKNDTVIIMWSSIGREDRWVNGKGWITPGSIYNQNDYDDNFVKKWACPTGYLIRDLAFVSAARKILDSIGCDWKFLSIVPLEYYDDSAGYDDEEFNIENRLHELYKQDIDMIRPSVYESVFNRDWDSRPGYVELDVVKRKYDILKGREWPSWTNLVSGNLSGIKPQIVKELDDHFNRDFIRTDSHPTPAEHLLYLTNVLPEYTISNDTVEWVNSAEDVVIRQRKPFIWHRQVPATRL